MKIGSTDIKEWNAVQWDVDVGNHEMNNNSEWVRGSPMPFMDKSTIGFKSIRTVLLIKDRGREAMTQDRSNILAALLKPVELTLDGFAHHFMAVIQKHSFEEDVNHRQDLWHKLTLEMVGYEFGAQEEKTGTSSISVSNPGNIITPAVIEILPTMGSAAITLTGISRDPDTGADLPVIIKNITTGNKVVIDGETGLVTQNGNLKAGDVDFWDPPTLLSGSNTITCDNDKMNITIKFKPRYM